MAKFSKFRQAKARPRNGGGAPGGLTLLPKDGTPPVALSNLGFPGVESVTPTSNTDQVIEWTYQTGNVNCTYDLCWNAATGTALRVRTNSGGNPGFTVANASFNNDSSTITASQVLADGSRMRFSTKDGIGRLFVNGTQVWAGSHPYTALNVRVRSGAASTSSPLDVLYGNNALPLVVSSESTQYETFGRVITVPVEYSDTPSGVTPDYLEIQYASGAWFTMERVDNIAPGVATFKAIVPTSVNGITSINVRWHNASTISAPLTVNIAIPFERRLGVNGGGLSTDISAQWEFWKDNATGS